MLKIEVRRQVINEYSMEKHYEESLDKIRYDIVNEIMKHLQSDRIIELIDIEKEYLNHLNSTIFKGELYILSADCYKKLKNKQGEC